MAEACTILGLVLVHPSNPPSDEEVKRAYKKMALKYHPDKNPSPEATAQFQLIAAAKVVLLSDGGDLPVNHGRHSGSGSGGGGNSHSQHACPNCDEEVFPPNDPGTKLFRCPICKHILRNPFFDPETSAPNANGKGGEGEML